MAYEKVKIGQTIQENNKIINDNFDESVNIADKGIPDGIATLDGSGKVPSSQLPEIPMTAKDIKMTGYVKPSGTSAITATDSADAAIGKLEKKTDENEAAIMDNTDDIDRMQGDIETLDREIVNIENVLSDIDDDFDNIALDINDINSQITNIGNDINTVNGKVTDLRTDIDSNASAIGAIETNINDIGDDVSALDDRITAAETDIAEIDGKTDDKITAAKSEIYRNTTNAPITTTEQADLLAIQPNPNDTSFHAMTIYGKTTQDGTPTPDNPIPIVSVVNPTVTVTNGVDTQSVTLDGITLNGIDDIRDTIEVKDGKVLHAQYWQKEMPDGTRTWAMSGTIVTGYSNYRINNYFGNANLQFNCTHFLAEHGGYTSNLKNRAINYQGGLLIQVSNDIANNYGNTNSTEWTTWLSAQAINGTPLTIMRQLATPIVTDITATANGQALLALHGYTDNTIIQFGNGAVGKVTYNQSLSAFNTESNNTLFTKTMSAAIATTDTADTLTITDISPNDTSFHAMTIYGKTTQNGTPTLDNPIPIVSVVDPTVTVSNGIDTQSVTLDGIALNGTDDIRDTIEVKDAAVVLAQKYNYLMIPTANLSVQDESTYETWSSTTYFYLSGGSILVNRKQDQSILGTHTRMNALQFGAIGNGTGKANTFELYTNGILRMRVPNNSVGILATDNVSERSTKIRAYFTANPLYILYPVETPTVTDITATPLGQALLAACKQGGTMIQVSDGTVSVKYNVSGQTIYDMLVALIGG